jgi:hypothetical protein
MDSHVSRPVLPSIRPAIGWHEPAAERRGQRKHPITDSGGYNYYPETGGTGEVPADPVAVVSPSPACHWIGAVAIACKRCWCSPKVPAVPLTWNAPKPAAAGIIRSGPSRVGGSASANRTARAIQRDRSGDTASAVGPAARTADTSDDGHPSSAFGPAMANGLQGVVTIGRVQRLRDQGNQTRKVVSPPSSLVTVIRPPCRLTISWQIASPRPVPPSPAR